MALDLLKVILVSPTWLGDAVMSLPLVGLLASAKSVRLAVMARGQTSRVYWGVDGVRDLVVLPDRARVRRILSERAVAIRTAADGAVILPPSFSSALGCFLAGVRTRVGFRSDARGFMLSASVDPRPLREDHLSKSYLGLGRILLENLGVPSSGRFITPKVKTFERDRKTIAHRLRTVGGVRDGYAVVVPGATYGPTKSWPAAKYRELVRLLSKQIHVALGGSDSEKDLCRRVGENVPGVTSFAGETTLGEFMALLEGARVVVANDSGAPHLAASLGVPAVVIFGSTSPRWTAPLGQDVDVVCEPVACSPCFRKTCPTRLECYEGISVERVLEVTRRVLEKSVEKGQARR